MKKPCTLLGHKILANVSKTSFNLKAKGENWFEGWLYGSLNGSSRYTGNEIAYIYSDMETSLFGQFDNEIMIEAREAVIKACRQVVHKAHQLLIQIIQDMCVIDAPQSSQ